MPMIRQMADRAGILKLKIWATSVVLTSAPNMTANAAGRVIIPLRANDVSKKAVAVELCKRAVTPRPDKNAQARFFVPV